MYLFERYDRLSEEMELLKQRCDGLLAAERSEYEKQLADLRTEARQREKRMKMENKRIRDDRVSDESAFKEVRTNSDYVFYKRYIRRIRILV